MKTRWLAASLFVGLLMAGSALACPRAPNVRRLVVDLHDQASEGQVRELAQRYGVRLQPISDHVTRDRIYRTWAALSHDQLPRFLDALRREPLVEAADLDVLFTIPEIAPEALTAPEDEALPVPQTAPQHQGFPNDPKYKFQWHLDQIRMPAAWKLGQGTGVVVAVVDTGVSPVEDLAGTELLPGWNFINNTADARDDHGHGTHVAGTIAQTTHNGLGVAGVAFQAKIMPIKVLSAGGSGSVGGIADGIRWAVDHGAQVINMSLGGRMNSQVLAKAVKYAHDKGVVVVCAAGNDGRGRVSYPAANDGAIAVAATQFDETTTFYSNWGKEIAVAAPGGNTRLDQNGDGVPDGVLQNTVVPGNTDKQDYLLFMGTSMAAPHVAGVAALIVGSGVRDPQAVRRILSETSRRPAAYRGKWDEHYGAGIVDAEAAVRAARKQSSHLIASQELPHREAAALALSVLLLLGLGLGLRAQQRGYILPS
jgi:serine protease